MFESGRERQKRESEKGVIREAGSERCHVDDIEDGGRGPQTKEFWWCLEARRAEEMYSLLQPSERNPAPSNT